QLLLVQLLAYQVFVIWVFLRFILVVKVEMVGVAIAARRFVYRPLAHGTPLPLVPQERSADVFAFHALDLTLWVPLPCPRVCSCPPPCIHNPATPPPVDSANAPCRHTQCRERRCSRKAIQSRRLSGRSRQPAAAPVCQGKSRVP